MKLTIANDALFKKVGEAESYRLIKEAGFDGVDLQCIDKKESDILLNHHREEAEKTRQMIEDSGLICNLAHAPFRKLFYGMSFDCSEPIYKELVNSIEYAAIAGAKLVAIHGILTPLSAKSAQSMEYNYKFFRSLAPYARDFGIKLAIENVAEALPYPYQMGQMLAMLDDPCFAALLDTGHARLCYVAPQNFIRDLPKGSIQALHVQDMRGIEKMDDHILPGMGKLKWDEILKALAEVGYDGDFNMEVHGFLKCFEPEALPSALKLAEQVAKLLAEQGYTVSNIDATVIAQRPKLASYIPTMRDKLADVFHIPADRVNVKATTEEKMGFTGRGEGIAAHAVCLIVK